MPVDTSALKSLDTKKIIEAIENGVKEYWDYEDDDVTLYETDGYSGEDADVGATIVFTEDIDLTEKKAIAVDFKFDGNNATDDLIIYLFKRRDDSWDDDEIAVWSATVDNNGSEDIYHFTIDESYGAGHFRFGLKSSGATTTFDCEIKGRYYQ